MSAREDARFRRSVIVDVAQFPRSDAGLAEKEYPTDILTGVKLTANNVLALAVFFISIGPTVAIAGLTGAHVRRKAIMVGLCASLRRWIDVIVGCVASGRLGKST